MSAHRCGGGAAGASFDGVTAAFGMNASVHAPLLCVTDDFDIASGKFSLPGKMKQSIQIDTGEGSALGTACRRTCSSDARPGIQTSEAIIVMGKDMSTKAPELTVERWFNSKKDLTLKQLLGRPVIIHAFQMLCPGCLAHAIPQTQKAHAFFAKTDLQVIGLHTVFKHHNAMTQVALEAFLHEYRIQFPVGVDKPDGQCGIPVTMAANGMRGTPTTLLIDRSGNLIANLFGQIEDLVLGAMIQSMLAGGTLQAGELIRAAD